MNSIIGRWQASGENTWYINDQAAYLLVSTFQQADVMLAQLSGDAKSQVDALSSSTTSTCISLVVLSALISVIYGVVALIPAARKIDQTDGNIRQVLSSLDAETIASVPLIDEYLNHSFSVFSNPSYLRLFSDCFFSLATDIPVTHSRLVAALKKDESKLSQVISSTR